MAIPFPVPPNATPEEALFAKLGVAYERRTDGVIVVTGDVHLYNDPDITALPDLSKVMLVGSFYCHESGLTSLKGAPFSVSGNFTCYGNQLASLEHAPKYVGGHFYCHRNKLTSLEHLPSHIGTDFWCHTNQLTSLAHAPLAVRGSFCCQKNRLTSLENAPMSFRNMTTDFGDFVTWGEVPQELKTSPETKERAAHAREAERREQSETAVKQATELQGPLAVGTPLRFRKPPAP